MKFLKRLINKLDSKIFELKNIKETTSIPAEIKHEDNLFDETGDSFSFDGLANFTQLVELDLPKCLIENQNLYSYFCTIYSSGFIDYKNNTTVDDLEKFKIVLSRFSNHYDSQYKLLKVFNASIYGCLGTICPWLAASITCLIRTFLIQICQYLTSKNYKILYCDTDGFYVDDGGYNFTKEINKKWSFTTIERHNIHKVIFKCTKTKILYTDDGWFWPQNKNGPLIWKEFIFYLFESSITTLADFKIVMSKFWEKLKDMDKSLFILNINLKDEYKTNTPAAEYLKMMKLKNPSFAGGFQKVFTVKIPSDINKLYYLPASEINNYEINFYKFFTPIFNVAHMVVKYKLTQSNPKVWISFSEKNFKLFILKHFLNVENNDSDDDDEEKEIQSEAFNLEPDKIIF